MRGYPPTLHHGWNSTLDWSVDWAERRSRRPLTGEHVCFHLFTSALISQQIISNDISELQKNQSITVAKIAQYKRKLMDLSHRVLQVNTHTFTQNMKKGSVVSAS